jgi:hypothetical protein
LWDAATGKDLLTLQGHEREVTSVAFAPDGKTLASASIDQTVRLWDVASGKELRKFQGHDAVVASVAYAPDGRSVCSGSYDTTILVWSVFAAPAAAAKSSDLRALWTELAGDDPVRAHRAIGALIASRKLAVPFLQGQLPRPVPGPGPERLAQLIAALDHNQFAERENAERELEKLGELAAPALERVLAGGPLSLEAHRRLVRLLEKLSAAASVPSKEELRWRRAIQALEQIGGTDVKSVLEKLAQTGPTGRLRRDAAAALQRLGQEGGGAKGG